jgi:hypothetical protein
MAQPKGRVTFRQRMKEDKELREKYVKIATDKAERLNEKYRSDPEYKAKMDKISRQHLITFNKRKLEEMLYKPALVSPDGIVYDKIKSLLQFANEHGLDSSILYKLYKGKFCSHKGWHLLNSIRTRLSKEERSQINKRTFNALTPEQKQRSKERLDKMHAMTEKSFKLRSPEGDLCQYKNISQFAREYGLSRTGLTALISGKRSSYKGWKRAEETGKEFIVRMETI